MCVFNPKTVTYYYRSRHFIEICLICRSLYYMYCYMSCLNSLLVLSSDKTSHKKKRNILYKTSTKQILLLIAEFPFNKTKQQVQALFNYDYD